MADAAVVVRAAHAPAPQVRTGQWFYVGFGIFVLLTGTCALTVRGRDRVDQPERITTPTAHPRLTRRQVLTWTGLAFLPSSLMLGVTAHITTDIAAIPLLWVVPLAIYLATFVVAFARTTRSQPPAASTRFDHPGTPVTISFFRRARISGSARRLISAGRPPSCSPPRARP